jgi:hypothetical protein
MSASNNSNRSTRGRNQGNRDEAEEEYNQTSSSSSADATRRLAQEDADAVRLAQEDADALITVRLAQEEADAVDAVRLAQEKADATRALELERRRTIIRQAVMESPSTLPLHNPSTNPVNSLSSTTAATPVDIVRQPYIINHIDLMTQGNTFLQKRNIQSKINPASAILCQ